MMNAITVPVAADNTRSEFDLDLSIVETGDVAGAAGSEPCTGDGCGGTGDSAGVTC
jgi:FxLD family lantipeptide